MCNPRQVWMSAICFGFFKSLMSKMRTPRKRAWLTVSSPLRAAVDATARLLYRHEQQVAVDGHVALSTGTHNRGDELHFLRRVDVVSIEAAEIPEEQIVAAKRDVGVGEVQAGRDLLCSGRRLGRPPVRAQGTGQRARPPAVLAEAGRPLAPTDRRSPRASTRS